MSKLSFARSLNGGFGYDRNGTTSKSIHNAKENYTEILCGRLSKVTIENRDGLKVIKTYDTPDTFHFIDPPYVGSNCGHYNGSFSEQNFIDLLELLSSIKGKFMLTMYPHSILQKFISENKWNKHKVERCLAASKARKRQEEWIITNYSEKEL